MKNFIIAFLVGWGSGLGVGQCCTWLDLPSWIAATSTGVVAFFVAWAVSAGLRQSASDGRNGGAA